MPGKGAAGQTQYAYDALGRLIVFEESRVLRGVRELYYALGGQVLEEWRNPPGKGPVFHYRDHVWGLGYVNALAMTQSMGAGERLYALQDANWNLTVLVFFVQRLGDSRPVWRVVERYIYDPYGTVTYLRENWLPYSAGSGLRDTGAFRTEYLFQGGRLNLSDGLYHFGARKLDPFLGRWMQQDALLYIDGMNLQEFVGSNPVNGVDPSGQVANIAIGAGLGALFGAGSYLAGNWLSGKEFDATDFWISVGTGTLAGAVGGATFGLGFIASGAAGGFVQGSLSSGIQTFRAGGDAGDVLASGGVGGLGGAALGALGGGVFRGVLGSAAGGATLRNLVTAGTAAGLITGGTGAFFSGQSVATGAATGGVFGGLGGALGYGAIRVRQYYTAPRIIKVSASSPMTPAEFLAQVRGMRANEFIFDTESNTGLFSTASGYRRGNMAPHDVLAASIGRFGSQRVVGGMFTEQRGRLFTNETSGHYPNWNPQTRQQLKAFMESMGIDITHQQWGR